ncbi:MAG: hypothetical protein GX767_08315 [Firmicutes bacterium]|nr:hypothetical protein [Bacillota bacterium]
MRQRIFFGQFLIYALAFTLFFITFFQGKATATESKPINIYINNQPLATDVPPLIIDGRTLVPFRPVLEALGAQVHWSASERKVTACKKNLVITLTIDSSLAYLQQEPVLLDVPPRILAGRTLTPLRFVAESLGATVQWVEQERSIYIHSPDPISFSISPDQIHLLPGHTQSLNLKAVFPLNLKRDIKPEQVSWSVEPEGIVEVKGARVTALRQGKATLTASYRDLKVELKARVYPTPLDYISLLSRDGQATITLPQEYPLLQVKVQKDNKSYTFRTLSAGKGKAEEKKKIILPYGEGTYQIEIDAWDNHDWVNVRRYLVYNPYPVPAPAEEYLYQRGYFNTTIEKPSLTLDVVDSIHIKGKSDAEYFIFRIRHTNDLDNPIHFSHYFAGGNIDTYLYLPLGEGLYHVTIFASATYKGTYRNTWDFFVNNKGNKLREDLIPTGEIQSDHPDIIRLARDITSGIERDYNKSKAIHNWVTANISYDTNSLLNGSMVWENNTALEVVKNAQAVCTGYANLTAALHRAIGIPALVIEGIARNAGNSPVSQSAPGEPNHAWNEVFVEGQWIILDTTWDAGYLDPETKKFVPDPRQLYFNPNPLVFSQTHTKIIP